MNKWQCGNDLLSDGGKYVEEGEKRYTKGETCHHTSHCCSLCILPSFLSLSLSFFPCLTTWEHCLKGETQIQTCGSCHPVLMPLLCFLFYFLWPPHPLLPPPLSPCLLRSLCFLMCTRPCRCNKTVHVCMFAASLFYCNEVNRHHMPLRRDLTVVRCLIALCY